MDPAELAAILEAALLSADEPLSVEDLRLMFADDATAPAKGAIRSALVNIAESWHDRPLELIEVSSGFRFRTRARFLPWLSRLRPEKPPRYPRATLETLAIIAYRQPVTRGDIEEIRGVSVATNTIRSLEERGWIDVVGHRDTPGRPALYATTAQFLNDLGLASLERLPTLTTVDHVPN
ncbi:MAG: SMC-Scp complex subunit ScpB [Zoogloeaceae bacterium]|jgi:segregation and condensation protein B|nr:SMC-Scp complex subunit ScpB [Zoogloeaceae bacterium]